MSTLQQRIRQAQRRLWFNRWLSILGWCLAAAALVFVLAVAAQRLFLPAHEWLGKLAAGLPAAAGIISLIWLYVRRESITAAAARLDHAAGLKERLSTGLYCETSEDPFAQAVVTDARQVAQRITVGQHLPVRVPGSAGYAGGTILLALLFFLLFPTFDLSGQQQAAEEQRERNRRVEKTQVAMKPVIEQQIRKAVEKNPGLKKDLEQLEALKEAKLETPADVRQELVKQVQKLTDKKEEAKKSDRFAQLEEFRKMMRQLADQQRKDSPVGALAKSLANGDFKAAQDALDRIQQELSKPAQTPEEQQKAAELKQQLNQLAAKLEKAAAENKKMQEELAKNGLNQEEMKRALEQLQKKDLNALSKELEKKGLSKQQIEKLMEQAKKTCDACKMAGKLGQNMAKAAQGGSDTGQLSQSAQDAMSAAGEQLSELESLQQEMNELNSQLADLENLKEQLGKGCSQCNGTGMKDGQPCSACQGSGMAQGGTADRGGGGMGSPGMGEGGSAPIEATSFKTVTKKAPVNTLPGSIISQQFVNGEQYKGEVSEKFVEATIAAKRDVTDAIEREQIPRSLQGPVSRYFTRSMGDLPQGTTAAEKPASENP